jgi:hypothetical protein
MEGGLGAQRETTVKDLGSDSLCYDPLFGLVGLLSLFMILCSNLAHGLNQ